MLRSLVTGLLRGALKLSTLGMKKRRSFSRYGMYDQISKFAANLDLNGTVLNISHSYDLARELGLSFDKMTNADYPDVSVFALPYPDASFDWVISDQCFEHFVGDPQAAMNETLRVLKPGGQLVHTTCFMTGYHGSAGQLEDYWRFSPTGLKFLCRAATESHADGIGHPLSNFLNSFFSFDPVPVATWHPVHWILRLNSPGHPSMVWVWAKK
jgi:SAM-dependent methyltransferase